MILSSGVQNTIILISASLLISILLLMYPLNSQSKLPVVMH